MNYYCTHSDINYLAKGIALYRSIYDKDTNFKLYYLCTDDESYKVLTKMGLPFVAPISLANLEQMDAELSKARNNPASQYGDAYSQFCWTLTPYFINWLLSYELPKFASLLYCDADLYFYHSPQLIFDACQGNSVGIHTHQFESYNPDTNNVGEFNVGCVYFYNDHGGKWISNKWKKWLLNPKNEYYQKYGTCGDQKYLDLFIPLFKDLGVCVFDRGHNILHGAPWNFTRYHFDLNNHVHKHGEQSQPLVFNHFSHFVLNQDGSWRSSDHGEWNQDGKPIEDYHPQLKTWYTNYAKELYNIQQLINNER